MNRSLLDETMEAWWDVRAGFIDEVKNIPRKHFDYRPVDEVRSVRELVVHVLEVAMMMTGELTRPDTDFGRAPMPKLLAMYAKPAYEAKTRRSLLTLLRSQLRDAEKRFRDAGEIALMQTLTRFDGQEGTKFTWLQHGIAQEMYHRGQVTVYARMLGLTPALTKKIHGEG